MVDRFFFLSAVWICHFTAFWPPLFLMRSQLLILLGFPCMWWGYFAAFKIFSFLVSYILTMMYLNVDLFECTSLGVHFVSWICRLTLFIKFGKFLAIIFSNLFLVSIFFSGTLIMHMLVHVMLLTFLWGSVHFFLPFSPLLDCIISINLSSCLLILLLPACIYCRAL